MRQHRFTTCLLCRPATLSSIFELYIATKCIELQSIGVMALSCAYIDEIED